MPRAEKNTAVKRRPVLDQNKKELMMAVLIRNEQAFKLARGLLKQNHFDEFERGYALTWTIVNEFFDEQNELPAYQFLHAEIQAAMLNDSSMFNDVEEDELATFLTWAFDDDEFEDPLPNSESAERWAIRTLKHFLEEKLASRIKDQLESSTMLVQDMPAFIEAHASEAASIASISHGEDICAFPDGWHNKANIKLFPVGIPFIDDYLGGGQSGGEVYTLMGPYGSCKTTLSAMIGVEGAKHFFNRKLSLPKSKKRLVFIAHYEASLEEMQCRTMGYAAQIHRDTFQSMNKSKTLEKSGVSCTGKYKAYEKKLYRKQIANGEKVNGEYERIINARQWLNEHLVFLDMRGAAPHHGRGNRGISELAQLIEHTCRKRKAACGLLIADYAGAMAKRYMAFHDLDPAVHTRHLLGNMPIAAKSMIADAFGCPVWLLHQLSGAANSKSPNVLPDHTDSAEAKNFGENADFCFSIGKPRNDDIALFGCTKHRRQAGRVQITIQIDGVFNRVVSANGRFSYNAHSKRIEDISDMQHAPESSKAKKANNDHSSNLATME